jgi:hypothetical protein
MTSVGVAAAGGRGCVDVASTGVVIGVGTAPAAGVSAADDWEALGFFLVMIQDCIRRGLTEVRPVMVGQFS